VRSGEKNRENSRSFAEELTLHAELSSDGEAIAAVDRGA
jgi:hypothetical protein